MAPEPARRWQQNGARSSTNAYDPSRFVDQHISPLFFRRTDSGATARDSKEIVSEEQFWGQGSNITFADVRLKGFIVTDWFPRAPGVYWSRYASEARDSVYARPTKTDAELGDYYSPKSKMGLIEDGGIGTVRLRPRRIDSEDCWLATALTGVECHRGIPLAIPDTVLRESGVCWGDRVNVEGRVRFLQDAGLEDTAARVHHARPFIIFVDKLEGIATLRMFEPILISPVSLFESMDPMDPSSRNRRGGSQYPFYAFVHCAAGSDSELDAAAEWIEKYATKFAGRIITNFDEQRPVLADAPLSYQRLVAKTYDRSIIERFSGTIRVNRIDQVIQESVTTQYYGDVHMGHKIRVAGPAIINIDTQLNNVTQTIATAPGLDPAQKSQLEALVQPLKADLINLQASHADEVKAIGEALERAVANASKPPQERKPNLLQLSANGLKEAAELVKDIAPSILTTATLIAKFIVGL